MEEEEERTTSSSPKSTTNELQLINPRKFLWTMAGTGLISGFAIGFMFRTGTVRTKHSREDLGLAIKALFWGTALCGSTAYLITKTTLWALDVHNVVNCAPSLIMA